MSDDQAIQDVLAGPGLVHRAEHFEDSAPFQDLRELTTVGTKRNCDAPLGSRQYLLPHCCKAFPLAVPAPMLPHRAKRSFHFGGEGSLVA